MSDDEIRSYGSALGELYKALASLVAVELLGLVALLQVEAPPWIVLSVAAAVAITFVAGGVSHAAVLRSSHARTLARWEAERAASEPIESTPAKEKTP
jgi:hypothetical protein